ncbi:MAG: 2-(1,2-epoxy-1,2-dihydrophenyl)acetyl-CoA isomerase PaaG [Bacteroidetes bacterium]|jgi:2-(1,2-epoxy-1,2-dihydrophenyl)acetyl-CoA isomerase|nr:2-(1,2-epoxy-1,2-dihydrophenyl)acetyl-CoA isomerase PaaG [Bacteroidota bacterium]
MDYKYIIFELHGQEAFIRLNRPEVFNSIHRDMAMEIQDALDRCKSSEVRCVTVIGSGRAFCAGQDLNEVVDPHGPALQDIVKEHYNPIIRRIRTLEKPVICAVNGVAAGAGANIALSGDIVVAARSASFVQAFSKIGLIPDSGGTYFLPRLVGMNRASALMMTGDKVGADEALQTGMLYKVYDDDAFENEVKLLSGRMASMPTYGLALTKKALNLALTNGLDQQLDVEEQLQTMAGSSADYDEGVKAFLEKRKPIFKGL